MTDPSPQDLDGLLKQWAEAHRPTEEKHRRLGRQVMARIADEVRDPVELPQRQQTSWEVQLMVGGGSLLVLLMLAGSLLYMNLSTVTPVAIPSKGGEAAGAPPGYPAESLLAAKLVAGKGMLLAETNSLFDQRLRWIAEGQEEMVVEVDDEQGQASREFLLVRLVVAERDSAAGSWRLLWQADVITRSEELVEVRPREWPGSSLALWAFVLPDGDVAVDMDLRIQQQLLDATTSTVLQTGQPHQVDCRQFDNIERCVFQTVRPLTRS